MRSRQRQATAASKIFSVKSIRNLSFSFTGPRKLDDIMKIELLEGKSAAEVSDIWMTYHEDKDRTYGLVLEGKGSEEILTRAAKWCVLGV